MSFTLSFTLFYLFILVFFGYTHEFTFFFFHLLSLDGLFILEQNCFKTYIRRIAQLKLDKN